MKNRTIIAMTLGILMTAIILPIQTASAAQPTWTENRAHAKSCKNKAKIWHVRCEHSNGRWSTACPNSSFRTFKGLPVLKQHRLPDRAWTEVAVKDPACGWPIRESFSLPQIAGSPNDVKGAYFLKTPASSFASWGSVPYVTQINLGRFKQGSVYILQGSVMMSNQRSLRLNGYLRSDSHSWYGIVSSPSSQEDPNEVERLHRVNIHLTPINNFENFKVTLISQNKSGSDGTSGYRKIENAVFSKNHN